MNTLAIWNTQNDETLEQLQDAYRTLTAQWSALPDWDAHSEKERMSLAFLNEAVEYLDRVIVAVKRYRDLR